MTVQGAFEYWYAEEHGPLYAGELGAYVSQSGEMIYMDYDVYQLWKSFKAGWDAKESQK